jgi:hypothetical protein
MRLKRISNLAGHTDEVIIYTNSVTMSLSKKNILFPAALKNICTRLIAVSLKIVENTVQ